MAVAQVNYRLVKEMTGCYPLACIEGMIDSETAETPPESLRNNELPCRAVALQNPTKASFFFHSLLFNTPMLVLLLGWYDYILSGLSF